MVDAFCMGIVHEPICFLDTFWAFPIVYHQRTVRIFENHVYWASKSQLSIPNHPLRSVRFQVRKSIYEVQEILIFDARIILWQSVVRLDMGDLKQSNVPLMELILKGWQSIAVSWCHVLAVLSKPVERTAEHTSRARPENRQYSVLFANNRVSPFRSTLKRQCRGSAVLIEWFRFWN